MASRRSNGGRTPTSNPELTPRQGRVAVLVCEGFSNTEIATSMTVSRKSVENYMRALYAYYGLFNDDGSRNKGGAKRVQLVLRINEDRQLCKLFGEDFDAKLD